MMIPRPVKFLIPVHVGISLLGLWVHLQVHPLSKSLYFWWASPVSLFSLVVLPVLFLRRATVGWGYVLNACTVAIGTIGMSYFSLLTFEPPLSLYRLFSESTLPNILLLWIKLPVAHLILRRMRPHPLLTRERGCAE
jgi:hypothetical protein